MAAKAVTIRIKQLRELQLEMKRGESMLDPAKVTPVLFAAMKIFYDEALKNLRNPEIVRRKTGNLEKGLTISPGKSSSIARAFVRNKSRHAHLIEYGHDIWHGGRVWSNGKFDHTKSNAVNRGRVPPHPFFRPALEATRVAVRKAIRAGLQKLLAGFPGKPGNATE